MSEAELAMKLYTALVEEGHDANIRFGMFDTPLVLGHMVLVKVPYIQLFDGLVAVRNESAVPSFGSRENKLKTGTWFLLMQAGSRRYHTDKTMTYMFGKALPDDVIDIHRKCVDIQNEAASMLKPEQFQRNI